MVQVQCSVTILLERTNVSRTFTLCSGGRLRIGRDQSNDFVLDIDGISACHAELLLRPVTAGRDPLIIQDRSKYGTGIRPGPKSSDAVGWNMGVRPAWEPLKRGSARTLDHGWQLMMPLGVKGKHWPLTIYVDNRLCAEEVEELDGIPCEPADLIDQALGHWSGALWPPPPPEEPPLPPPPPAHLPGSRLGSMLLVPPPPEEPMPPLPPLPPPPADGSDSDMELDPRVHVASSSQHPHSVEAPLTFRNSDVETPLTFGGHKGTSPQNLAVSRATEQDWDWERLENEVLAEQRAAAERRGNLSGRAQQVRESKSRRL